MDATKDKLKGIRRLLRQLNTLRKCRICGQDITPEQFKTAVGPGFLGSAFHMECVVRMNLPSRKALLYAIDEMKRRAPFYNVDREQVELLAANMLNNIHAANLLASSLYELAHEIGHYIGTLEMHKMLHPNCEPIGPCTGNEPPETEPQAAASVEVKPGESLESALGRLFGGAKVTVAKFED